MKRKITNNPIFTNFYGSMERENRVHTFSIKKSWYLAGVISFVTGVYFLLLLPAAAFSQGVSINITGNNPNSKSMLDIDVTGMNPKTGLLIPRMTTTERNAITAPIPESLLIYNTSTQCFEAWNNSTSMWVSFGCIGCIVPTGVTASASPDPICEGSTLTLTGGATGTTSWNWTGPNSYTSTLQNPSIASITTAGTGIYTLQACNNCGCQTAYTASVTVNAPPSTSNAGSDINPACGVSTATLAGNTPTIGTGTWSVISGTATITTPSSPTSGVTSLAVPGVATLRWTISNAPCADSYDDVVITTTSCFTCGTSTLQDYDGNTYNTVSIGSQCWLKQNLKTTHYRGGTAITNVTDNATWASLSTEAYCWYNNNYATYGSVYGALYNWHAVNHTTSGIFDLCPAGWHVPSDAEWCAMENTVEAGTDPGCNIKEWRGINTGDHLKEAGTSHWTSPNGGADNSSNFTALPGGYRYYGDGSFDTVGDFGFWWTATEYNTSYAWYRALYYINNTELREYTSKNYGKSVRCVMD